MVVVEESVVCFVVASELEETSWNTAAAVAATAGDEEVVDSTIGVEAAATGVLEDVVTIAATAATDEEEATEVEPEVPKLLDAVVEAPLLTSTFLMITESPLSLVTLMSTVVVPNPALFSKKL